MAGPPLRSPRGRGGGPGWSLPDELSQPRRLLRHAPAAEAPTVRTSPPGGARLRGDAAVRMGFQRGVPERVLRVEALRKNQNTRRANPLDDEATERAWARSKLAGAKDMSASSDTPFQDVSSAPAPMASSSSPVPPARSIGEQQERRWLRQTAAAPQSPRQLPPLQLTARAPQTPRQLPPLGGPPPAGELATPLAAPGPAAAAASRKPALGPAASLAAPRPAVAAASR